MEVWEKDMDSLRSRLEHKITLLSEMEELKEKLLIEKKILESEISDMRRKAAVMESRIKMKDLLIEIQKDKLSDLETHLETLFNETKRLESLINKKNNNHHEEDQDLD